MTTRAMFTNASPLYQDAFTLDLTEAPQGAGSGIIWDGDGHLVTNFHVIKEANELRVTMQNQEACFCSKDFS